MKDLSESKNSSTRWGDGWSTAEDPLIVPIVAECESPAEDQTEFACNRPPADKAQAIGLDERAWLVWQLAYQEALRLSAPKITPVHLLLGMLKEKESGAARLLAEHGITLREIRDRLLASPADEPVYRFGKEGPVLRYPVGHLRGKLTTPDATFTPAVIGDLPEIAEPGTI